MKKNIIRLLLILSLFAFSNCAKHIPKPPSNPLSPLKYIQFGKKFFVFKPQGKPLIFKKVKKIEEGKDGMWVEPKERCILINPKTQKLRLCLKPVPMVYPHIKVLKIDSYAVNIRILSLFPQIFLLIWEKGKVPSVSKLKAVSPGNLELKNLSVGKSYFISGAIKYKNTLYGPLSPPLLVKVKDNEPPLPPSGGGYLIKDKEILLLWDPSPSRDVAYYVVEKNGKKIRVKECSFEEELSGQKVVYKIKAVDFAGNESPPLEIKVNFLKVKEKKAEKK